MCSWKINCWSLVVTVLSINSCICQPYAHSGPQIKNTYVTPVRSYRLIAGSVPDDLDSLQYLSQPPVEENPDNMTETAVVQEDLKSDVQTENSIDRVSSETVNGTLAAVPPKPANADLALLIQSMDLTYFALPFILLRSFVVKIVSFLIVNVAMILGLF